MKILGVDYGKKKVGLAISEGLTASPLYVLEVTSLKDAVEKVSSVINKEVIEKTVVGVPESGEAMKITKNFVTELRKKGVDVTEADETLSSYQAGNLMVELGSTKSSRKSEDAYSAAIILQNYLDEKIG